MLTASQVIVIAIPVFLLMMLAAVAVVLWVAHRLTTLEVVGWSAALVVTFWSLGAVLQAYLSARAMGSQGPGRPER